MTSPGSDRLAGAAGRGYVAAYEPAMRLAIQAARAGWPGAVGVAGAVGEVPGICGEARDLGAGDVPVGAVVLSPEGAVIARGRNACLAGRDPTAHAEVVAIRLAAREACTWRLDGCTLVATLEPCVMCAGALLAARIGRLVYGAPDARAGAAGSLWDVVRDRRLGPPVEVIAGVLAAECAALLSGFFGELRREP